MNTQTNEYLMLFRGPHWDKGLSNEDLQQMMNRVMAWFDGLKNDGRVKGGQALASEGRTVSGKSGMVADGPFAESKETIGGYLLIEAGSLEEAVAFAQSNPTLGCGITIEVRPVAAECPCFERARKRLLPAQLAPAN